jgi:aspartate oxidase
MRAVPTLTGFNPNAADNKWAQGGVAATFANGDVNGVFVTALGPTLAAGLSAALHVTADARI